MNTDRIVSYARCAAGRMVLISYFVLLSPGTVLPLCATANVWCACCANPGVWSLETRKPDEEMWKELNRLKPNERANFYATEAWPEDLKGVAIAESPDPNPLVVSLVREARAWKFFFKTAGGGTGALVLTLPAAATFFHVDNEPRSKTDNPSPVTVYKEIRMEGAVRGTGIFAKGINPATKYRLVLQGKGNMCVTTEDFTRWNLRIAGPQASYSFYGAF